LNFGIVDALNIFGQVKFQPDEGQDRDTDAKNAVNGYDMYFGLFTKALTGSISRPACCFPRVTNTNVGFSGSRGGMAINVKAIRAWISTPTGWCCMPCWTRTISLQQLFGQYTAMSF
jgi:hypothetical protein